MVEYKVKNKIEPFDLGEISEKGYIGNLIDRMIYNRMNSDFARNTVYPLCEDVFRTRPDDRTGMGLWQGEFWGKWMLGACKAARYTGDADLKDFLHRCALGVISTQEENGYIGTYKNSKFFMPVDKEKGQKIVGWPCDWNWNLWCRKYTLWGIVEAYLLTEDKKLLDAAEKMFAHIEVELSEEGRKLWETGTFVGMPSCSMINPILLLYRITGNKKYLNFVLEIADHWDNDNDEAPNLIRNAFTGKAIDYWYDNEGGKWTKVYELLSCLSGLLELYRLTGTKRYYDSVASLADLLIRDEQNPIFSVGFNDQFMSGGYYVNAGSEPCDVFHWFRLLYDLYLLSGDSGYVDKMEIVGYNPLLASITYDGIWCARIVRSHGKHQFAPPQPGPDPLPHHHCCVNNLPKSMINFAESAVVRNGKDIYINFYSPIEIDSDICVKIFDGYLCGKEFKVETKGAERVFVRLPGHCNFAKLCGESINSDIGYYQIPEDKRESFTLLFDANPRILKFEKEMIFPEEGDVHHRRFTLNTNDVGYVDKKYMIWTSPDRIMYGPLLLARSVRLCDDDIVSVKGGHEICSVEPQSFAEKDFQIVCKVKADSENYIMCDFASAAKVKDESAYDYIFNMYI